MISANLIWCDCPFKRHTTRCSCLFSPPSSPSLSFSPRCLNASVHRILRFLPMSASAVEAPISKIPFPSPGRLSLPVRANPLTRSFGLKDFALPPLLFFPFCFRESLPVSSLRIRDQLLLFTCYFYLGCLQLPLGRNLLL